MERVLKVDLSALKDRYRSSREEQRTHTRVEHLRPVSSDLSKTLSLVPVTQSLSPWKPHSNPPLVAPDQTPSDPWHEHLCLHRRSSHKNQTPPSSSDSEDNPLSPPLSPAQKRPDPVLNQTHTQFHYPFPNRRTPRISETARRLGLYSS